MSNYQAVPSNTYKCDFALKIIPGEPFPDDRDTLETLDNDIVSLSNEMALMLWLQEVYEEFIGLNVSSVKSANGEFVQTMEDFISSPEVEFFKSENGNELKLKIIVQKNTSCWYELTVKSNEGQK